MIPGDLLSVVPAARLHLPAGVAPHGPGADLEDVTHDSRDARPGVLLACRPGARFDGHDFAAAGVAAGSPALLVERALDLPVPQVVVPSVADALGPVAAAVHGNPSQQLVLLGVTGTSGKTTTTFLLEAALAACGHTTGLIGTVETRVAGASESGPRTTPEATDLQRLLARMVRAGVTAAAMEVSSHGLALGRVAGTRFGVVGFTNLSQDHLDFHDGLEDYFAAKASLFDASYAGRGAVDVSGPWGQRLAATAAIAVDHVSAHALAERPEDVRAGQGAGGPHRGRAWHAEDVAITAGGCRFTAVHEALRVPVALQLPGAFNVANGLLALALATLAGCEPVMAAKGMAALRGVPGRMEPVDAGQSFTVLVDYAHKPDALANVLHACRDLAGAGLGVGKVIVVVGCGGDRDREKRPVMGRIAAEGADLVVLTSDNPRSEEPAAIVAAMLAGARAVPGAAVAVEVDRAAAIGLAIASAGPGDVALIAGKGHETYQELGDRTIPFDDREVARAALASLPGSAAARGPVEGSRP